MALNNLCKHCQDIIQWKLDFRKYKPLTTPSRCNKCQEKNIIKAYRAICDRCALKDKDNKLCTKCEQPVEGEYAEYKVGKKAEHLQQVELEIEMDEVLQKLRERCKKTVLRKIETGEVTFDKKRKIFKYKDTDEEVKV